MKLDEFMLDSGIANVAGEIDDRSMQVLVDGAEAFLRAGGQVTWTLWKGLSEESRAAFVVAGNLVWRERFGWDIREKAASQMALSNALDIAEKKFKLEKE